MSDTCKRLDRKERKRRSEVRARILARSLEQASVYRWSLAKLEEEMAALLEKKSVKRYVDLEIQAVDVRRRLGDEETGIGYLTIDEHEEKHRG